MVKDKMYLEYSTTYFTNTFWLPNFPSLWRGDGVGLWDHHTVCVPTFLFLNHLTNFHKILYECHATSGHPNHTIFIHSFLQSVIAMRVYPKVSGLS
jgi:hypothetical protein